VFSSDVLTTGLGALVLALNFMLKALSTSRYPFFFEDAFLQQEREQFIIVSFSVFECTFSDSKEKDFLL